MNTSLIKKKGIELKKQIILNEAKKLINEVGYEKARMEDIAKRVGFSKASLYSYFRDKEEIALSISKDHIKQFCNKIHDLPVKNIPVMEKLLIMKNSNIEFLKKSKNFIIIKPDFSLRDNIHSDFIKFKRKNIHILRTVLEQGKKEGVFNSNLNVIDATNLLESMFTGIIFISSIVKNFKQGFTTEFDLEHMTHYAMDFFYTGITGKNNDLNLNIKKDN
jgi:TetR/AcrR family fatty acid metabolism transcriptional regulator